MLDIAIIGAGPAGMSAAINGIIRNKKILLIGYDYKTSALYKAERVDNYLGMPSISGKEMMDSFYKHTINMGVEFKKGRVLQILSMDSHFVLNVDNDFIESQTVIIAVGAAKGLSIKGEKEYLGRGVSYCATCDGMLFKNKKVVVCSDNKEGEKDAYFLNEICDKVYYIPKYNLENELDDIEIVNSKPVSVFGDDYVKGIELSDRIIDCDGVFLIKNVTPVDSLISGLALNSEGSINVNKNMETNIKGLFAAGDCVGKPFQISKAVGEGLVASQQAITAILKM